MNDGAALAALICRTGGSVKTLLLKVKSFLKTWVCRILEIIGGKSPELPSPQPDPPPTKPFPTIKDPVLYESELPLTHPGQKKKKAKKAVAKKVKSKKPRFPLKPKVRL
jgi:hypothetical protein